MPEVVWVPQNKGTVAVGLLREKSTPNLALGRLSASYRHAAVNNATMEVVDDTKQPTSFTACTAPHQDAYLYRPRP